VLELREVLIHAVDVFGFWSGLKQMLRERLGVGGLPVQQTFDEFRRYRGHSAEAAVCGVVNNAPLGPSPQKQRLCAPTDPGEPAAWLQGHRNAGP